MMQAAAHISLPRLVVPDPLPVAAFLKGKTGAEASDLLPRLFNICPAAQRMAVHLALDLPISAKLRQALRAEIVRDHVLKLCVDWPARLGLAPLAGALTRPLAEVVDATLGVVPRDFDGLCRARSPFAAMARAVARAFPDRSCAKPDLGDSAACRWQASPLLRSIADRYGTGPLWRLAGRAVELEALAQNWTPQAYAQKGVAFVPAARGLYTLAITLIDGRVVGLNRVTPTDRMLAPEANLTQTAKSVTTPAQGELLIALYDPCTPVALNWRAEDA